MTLNCYNNLLRYHCYINFTVRELRARDNEITCLDLFRLRIEKIRRVQIEIQVHL